MILKGCGSCLGGVQALTESFQVPAQEAEGRRRWCGSTSGACSVLCPDKISFLALAKPLKAACAWRADTSFSEVFERHFCWRMNRLLG